MKIQCNNTGEVWYLTCREGEWIGDFGNCTGIVVYNELLNRIFYFREMTFVNHLSGPKGLVLLYDLPKHYIRVVPDWQDPWQVTEFS